MGGTSVLLLGPPVIFCIAIVIHVRKGFAFLVYLIARLPHGEEIRAK